jgi:hypothetical protein
MAARGLRVFLVLADAYLDGRLRLDPDSAERDQRGVCGVNGWEGHLQRGHVSKAIGAGCVMSELARRFPASLCEYMWQDRG